MSRTPSSKTVLITGATGTVGGAVTRQLIKEHPHVRALARHPEHADQPSGVEVVQGDLSRPDSLSSALDGVDAVFLVWPFITSDGAAEVLEVMSRRVRRVVQLSSRGADAGRDNPILRFHGELERLIAGTELEWTALRPASFATNTLGWVSGIADGVVRAPFADQARSLIHEHDIAAVAVRALLDDDLVGATPELTGPASLTTREQVQTIGQTLQIPLRYEEQPIEEAAQVALANGFGADLVAALYAPQQSFETQHVTTDVRDLTGRESLTFARWVQDHASQLTGTSAKP